MSNGTCLSHTYIKNDGRYILWDHLTDLYYRDKGKATGVSIVPKLKYEHIHLTSFAKMRVDLAVQVSISKTQTPSLLYNKKVLSESVSKALVVTGGLEAKETAAFTMLFDKFFDILNVTNFTNGTRKRKPFQHPFRHSEDKRLKVSYKPQSLILRYNYSAVIVARRRFSPVS